MRAIDEKKLEELAGRLIGDIGACVTGALVVLGDRLGLYKAMADGAPVTAAQLAAKTGYKERYLREWLSAQAAADYVSYDEGKDAFFMTPEQATAFAQDDSPAFFAGGFEVIQSLWMDEPKIAEAFKAGKGFGWHEHSNCLFRGTERFFRPGYNANIVSNWVPAIDGLQKRMEAGVSVADVGCGHGASTLLMAKAYPNSRFTGFDYHMPSVERARMLADAEGVAGRVRFEQATAKDFPARGYDLVAMFDCLHDMGDPVGAGKHVKETLGKDGVWMIVEPYAKDKLSENLNPIGRIFYGASTMICTPASLSQEVGLGLGAQAGEMRLRKVVLDAGFTRFRKAAETPVNMVFEARA